ncbi:hypothetical protein PSY81_23780, partial [Shigella flexneri]|nr:hypothetical protein [Shigella flexneri]
QVCNCAVYVKDMNLIDILEEIKETAKPLKSEFEMKGLGRTDYCLDLELEHSANEKFGPSTKLQSRRC